MSNTFPSSSCAIFLGLLIVIFLGCSSTSPETNRTVPVLRPSPIPNNLSGTATDSAIDERSELAVRQNILDAHENRTLTYEHLKKNPQQHSGKAWAFSGRIIQIQEEGELTFALVALDQWNTKTMAVRADFSTPFVENDRVYVVGQLAGSYSYTSVAGWEITVPSITARAIITPREAAQLRGAENRPSQRRR